MGRLYQELKRRNVFRACAAYLAGVWLLLQVGDIVVPMFGWPDWVLQALFLSALVGFPMAVVLAWFYDLTPKGLRSAADIEAGEAVPLAGRKVDFAIIGVLVLAVGFLLVNDRAPEIESRSIAVLPFDNRSADEQDAEFFAEGIHEDLIVMLSKLSDIRVISRKSVDQFAGTTRGTRQIADALGVSTVLEGGVRVAGNRVRINVQLIDAATDTNLWAETYDRELSTANIFGIQSEVALHIVSQLQAELSSEERKRLAVVPTRSLEAYEAYVLGKRDMASRTEPALQSAIRKFERAIALDENFALAYVGIADSYAVLEDWGHLATDYVRPLVREAATRALEIDPQLGEAWVSMAAYHEFGGDFAAADTAYRRAIELRPGYATAHSWYGLLLRWRLGRYEDALKEAEQALLLDPLSPVLHMAYGDVLFAMGRFDDARAAYERSIEIDPAFGGSYKMLGDLALYAYGQTAEALKWYRAAIAVERDPDWVGDIAGIYMVLGDYDQANMWAGQARTTDPENIFLNKHLALLYYYQGEDDAAAEYARKFLGGPLDAFAPYMLAILRNTDLEAGKLEDAMRWYERIYPDLAGSDPGVNRANYRAAIDFAVVLAAMSQPRRAELLLSKSLETVRTLPRLGLAGYGSAEAEIHALLGRPADALLALEAAVADGWWRHWYFWTERNPNFDSIRSEPAYRDVIAALERRMAGERANLEASANAPRPDVPPSAGTVAMAGRIPAAE